MLLALGHELLSWCLCSWACLACCFLLCPYISCLCCVTNNPKYSELKNKNKKLLSLRPIHWSDSMAVLPPNSTLQHVHIGLWRFQEGCLTSSQLTLVHGDSCPHIGLLCEMGFKMASNLVPREQSKRRKWMHSVFKSNCLSTSASAILCWRKQSQASLDIHGRKNRFHYQGDDGEHLRDEAPQRRDSVSWAGKHTFKHTGVRQTVKSRPPHYTPNQRHLERLAGKQPVFPNQKPQQWLWLSK